MTPRFWSQPGTWQAWALAPLGWIYGLAAETRWRLTTPKHVSIPVICVGNFTLGGAGKTPVAIAIIERLKAFGENPFILTRGHGGALSGPHRVDAQKDTAVNVGDEALLHARHAPVIVSRDRVAGAHLAVSQGAGVIVMDDGMQNPSLEKHLTIAVIDAQSGLGNGFVFPAGPLRGFSNAQQKRVDAILQIGRESNKHTTLKNLKSVPVLSGSLQPLNGEWLKAKRVLGFCGIGNPQKFHATLQQLGAEVVRFESFPDHYMYDAGDAKRLIALAASDNLTLVTTEKDHVRLQAFPETRAQLAGLANTVSIKFVADDAAQFDTLLKSVLSLRDNA